LIPAGHSDTAHPLLAGLYFGEIARKKKRVFSLSLKTLAIIGAEDWNRTSTREPSLEPESSASTNSATSA
jgi:hypothetical protein